jgi:hypothetical protein
MNLLQKIQLADKAVLKEEDEKLDEQGQKIDLESEGTLRCVECQFLVRVVSELN